ncbi:MFS transporter [Pectobacterium araliae]|uniref:MFS transporter n=1 Tax=Pectobacterium araliae TaxID=3073862 RepID=A0AAN0KDL8_9GAMM|nr:MFS transporter [Pectobacterium sp. MAFF 302110]GKW21401.1 MFS transporter [Pectobacterium carotovorum subsp. carotovorum]
MYDSLKKTQYENAPKPIWPLALCAGLLGLGQNGLLVVLPQLVAMTGLSLSVWAGLLMFGSILFLPSSPWWGRQAEIQGCKRVVLSALIGCLVSFCLMAFVVWGMAEERVGTDWGVIGLIASRMIYGLSVSGLVPAAQTWAMQRAGMEKRMAALATISSGLSCGRLLGPPIAALSLGVSPQAPLWLMVFAPLVALMLMVRQPNDPPMPPIPSQSAHLRIGMLPFLLLALLLAASISMMQLGLAPHLTPLYPDAVNQVSHHIALLLSTAAASTLLAQFLLVRPQRLSPMPLLCLAALLMVTGLLMMTISTLVALYCGIALASFGSAMATPGYQLLLNDHLTTGKGAGMIATSHTLGYGLSALLVPLVAAHYGEQALISTALLLSLCFLSCCGWLFYHHQTKR